MFKHWHDLAPLFSQTLAISVYGIFQANRNPYPLSQRMLLNLANKSGEASQKAQPKLLKQTSRQYVLPGSPVSEAELHRKNQHHYFSAMAKTEPVKLNMAQKLFKVINFGLVQYPHPGRLSGVSSRLLRQGQLARLAASHTQAEDLAIARRYNRVLKNQQIIKSHRTADPLPVNLLAPAQLLKQKLGF
jgi:hypothetical protein